MGRASGMTSPSSSGMAALLLGGLGVAGAWAQPAAPIRPPAGTDVDETRFVMLATGLPAPCVALPADGADIVLSRADLEALAAATPPAWKTEAERQALIDGRRARALIAGLAPPGGGQPCATPVRAGNAEARALVLSFLERGAAAVRDTRTGALVDTVQVRYVGQRCGPLCGRGFIGVSLPGQARPFLVLDWWVS